MAGAFPLLAASIGCFPYHVFSADAAAGMDVKEEFINLLGSLGSQLDRRQFLQWIRDDVVPAYEDSEEPELVETRKKLFAVAEFVKGIVPNFEAVMPSEKLYFPEKFAADGDETMTRENTVHLDGFLYDEDDEGLLVSQGKLPQAICNDCGSKNASPIQYITHSASKESLELIFTSLLPPLNESSVVLDVGSRLGAVLYGAYFYTPSKAIIGIEMNEDLCQLQARTIAKFSMMDRISVVCAEMSTRPDLLERADVIILNNVFEFFTPGSEVRRQLWLTIMKNVKPGSFLVIFPGLDKSMISEGLGYKEFVEEVGPFQKAENCLKIEDESAKIHLYRVLNK